MQFSWFEPSYPAHGQVRIDETGAIWVLSYAIPGSDSEPVRWSIFSPEGRYLGELTPPEGLNVTQITDSTMIGVWKDDLDVEYVRVYRLER